MFKHTINFTICTQEKNHCHFQFQEVKNNQQQYCPTFFDLPFYQRITIFFYEFKVQFYLSPRNSKLSSIAVAVFTENGINQVSYKF